MNFPPFAVRISDGVIVWQWLALGFIASGLLFFLSSFRITDGEIPRIGMLTAVFFVTSLIHVPVGPASVHLLLNGLLGLILGRRAILAIAVGLFLQCVLFQHGGLTALGINLVVVSVPALLARPLFAMLIMVHSR